MAEFDPFAHMSPRVMRHFENYVNGIILMRPSDADAINAARKEFARGFLAGWNQCLQDVAAQVRNLAPDAELQAMRDASSQTKQD